MHLDNRIIASVDTLKRPARIKRLLEAPRWDLVVFGEAHHLSCPFGKRAYRKDTMLQDHARQACYLLHLSAPWFHVSSKPP